MDCSIISSHQHEWQQRTSINDQNNQGPECVTSGKMNQNWCSVIDQDLMTKCRITGIFLLFKIAEKKNITHSHTPPKGSSSVSIIKNSSVPLSCTLWILHTHLLANSITQVYSTPSFALSSIPLNFPLHTSP